MASNRPHNVVLVGLGWVGLGWVGLGWVGLGWVGCGGWLVVVLVGLKHFNSRIPWRVATCHDV